MPGKNQNFKGVSLNKNLYIKVTHFVQDSQEYRSVADFLSEAARMRMEQLEAQKAAKCQVK